MKTLIVLLVALVAMTEVESGDEATLNDWNSFKVDNVKAYGSEADEKYRMNIFNANKQQINVHNSKYEKGLVSFKLKINNYADMPHDEFVRTMTGFKPQLSKNNKKPVAAKLLASAELPNEVDWRKNGAVTEVKYQGLCGACWAFAAAGSLEGQHFKKSGKLVPLSSQNLLDCSGKHGNLGCNGGTMTAAFQYIIENKGIEAESTYKYEGKVGNCHYDPKKAVATVARFAEIPEGDEEQLRAAVATIGPVAVGIHGSVQSFQLYGSGIYTDSACKADAIDHAVLVVGYGSENGKPFWLVKNSWSTQWGEQGYARIARNSGNLCGIATIASYPVI